MRSINPSLPSGRLCPRPQRGVSIVNFILPFSVISVNLLFKKKRMEMMTTPLNTTQLEILKLFSRDLPETDLLALKRVLVRFLAERATQMADAIYEQKGWTEKI